jgi:hypothetical protein
MGGASVRSVSSAGGIKRWETTTMAPNMEGGEGGDLSERETITASEDRTEKVNDCPSGHFGT